MMTFVENIFEENCHKNLGDGLFFMMINNLLLMPGGNLVLFGVTWYNRIATLPALTG